MKVCTQCHQGKPDTSYYTGLGKCKECHKANVRAHRASNAEHYKEYEKKRANLPRRVKARKAYTKTDKGKEAGNRAKRKWQENNILARAAHIIVGHALKAGKLVKHPCEICGRKDSHGHHDDYSKPLDVRWLCAPCHKAAHKLLRGTL